MARVDAAAERPASPAVTPAAEKLRAVADVVPANESPEPAVDVANRIGGRGGKSRRLLRVREPVWQVMLVNDAILPTVPQPIGATESVEAVRQRLVAAQRARLPETMRAPVLRSGYRVERVAAPEERPWRWRAAPAGGEVEVATSEGQADLAWGELPPAGAKWLLEDERGRVYVAIEVGADRTVPIAGDDAVRIRRWIELKLSPYDESGGGDDRAAGGRFGWRSVADRGLPDGWRAAESGGGAGASERLEIPFAPAHETMAFADRVTGWALVGAIEQTAEASSVR
jgi:hypothetical protein